MSKSCGGLGETGSTASVFFVSCKPIPANLVKFFGNNVSRCVIVMELLAFSYLHQLILNINKYACHDDNLRRS